MTTTAMTASPGQQFIGLPSGTNYIADGSGNIPSVLQQDLLAMIKAGCQLQASTSVMSLPISASGTQPLSFASTGDIEYNVTLTGACTFTINAPTANGTFRRLILRINPNGYQATLPASSATILNSGGSAPTPSTSAVTIYTYGYDGITVDGGM